MSSFLLLTHSHGIALLDALTDWRKSWRANNRDIRYGEAFQGWFDGSMPAKPFVADVFSSAPPQFKSVTAWILSGSQNAPLIEIDYSPDLTLKASSHLTEVLGEWNGKTPLVSMIHGNEHARTSLNQWPPYDFLDDDVAEFNAEAQVVDSLFIDSYVQPWINPVYLTLLAVRRLVSNPIIHVLPPPPRENPGNARHLETLADEIKAYGFLPDYLRLKWYRRYCRLLGNQLANIECKVLEPPVEACSQQGMLKEAYAEGLTHGNGRYGDALARKLACCEEFAAPAP